jgi:hypothetical protein
MRDPVLDREMFRSTRKDVEEGGIAAVADAGDEGYNSRVEEAKRLFDQARVKQDPSRFQTLSEQEKPGVFRPIQAGATQMPQPNVQQQMAQMQAMGFRPVGMARGGFVSPTVSPVYPGASAAEAGRVGQTSATVTRPKAYSLDNIEGPPPSEWTDEDIQSMANDIFATESAEGKTPFRRGIQSLFGGEPTSRESILDYLTRQRDMARNEAGAEEERRRKAIIENPVPSIFTEVSSEEYGAAKERQRKALEGTSEETPGVRSIEPAKEEAAPEVDTAEMEREARRGVGLSTRPSGIEALDETEARREFLRGKALSDMEQPAAPAAPVSPKEEADKSNVFDSYSTNLEKIKADRAAQRQENINLSLIQAGLAIAGGSSPNALANIGAGGISGLQAFGQAEKESRVDYRQAMQELRSEQERARDEAFRREGLDLQKSAQRFRQEVEVPEAQRQREADTEARREAKLELAKERTLTALDREISRLNTVLANPGMMAASEADKKKIQDEIDSLEARRYNLLNELPQNTPKATADFSGFRLVGVK